jgi:hypothetical protein
LWYYQTEAIYTLSVAYTNHVKYDKKEGWKYAKIAFTALVTQ